MLKYSVKYIIERIIGLWYRLKIFTEGKRIRDKVLLFPNTIFVYLPILIACEMNLPILNTWSSLFMRFGGRAICKPSTTIMVENKMGIYKCRPNSLDAMVIVEAYERKITKYLASLKEGVFVDLGANIGRYTIMVARQLGDKGKVVAIEADTENYQALVENIKLNKLENVHAFNIACWYKEEDIKFVLSKIDAKLMSHIASAREVSDRVITVHGNTLDNILKGLGIKEVDIVKMDVEGAEKEVLLGMKDTIAESQNIEILFEASNESYLEGCTRVLQDYGLVVDNKGYERHMYRARR